MLLSFGLLRWFVEQGFVIGCISVLDSEDAMPPANSYESVSLPIELVAFFDGVVDLKLCFYVVNVISPLLRRTNRRGVPPESLIGFIVLFDGCTETGKVLLSLCLIRKHAFLLLQCGQKLSLLKG